MGPLLLFLTLQIKKISTEDADLLRPWAQWTAIRPSTSTSDCETWPLIVFYRFIFVSLDEGGWDPKNFSSQMPSLSTHHLFEELLDNLLRRIWFTICMPQRFAGYLDNITIIIRTALILTLVNHFQKQVGWGTWLRNFPWPKVQNCVNSWNLNLLHLSNTSAPASLNSITFFQIFIYNGLTVRVKLIL